MRTASAHTLPTPLPTSIAAASSDTVSFAAPRRMRCHSYLPRVFSAVQSAPHAAHKALPPWHRWQQWCLRAACSANVPHPMRARACLTCSSPAGPACPSQQVLEARLPLSRRLIGRALRPSDCPCAPCPQDGLSWHIFHGHGGDFRCPLSAGCGLRLPAALIAAAARAAGARASAGRVARGRRRRHGRSLCGPAVSGVLSSFV